VRVIDVYERTSPGGLREVFGPYVLIQRPPAPVYNQLAKVLGRGETVQMAHAGRLGEDILELARAFEALTVVPLPELALKGELVIGRADECNVLVHEPSVSSRHALLRCNNADQHCVIQDLDSRNGTFVNARRIFGRESVLEDGDAVSFGDAQFFFMRPETVQEQMATLRPR
jgi:hypothetical protein